MSYIWKPPSLSELAPMMFNTHLTHLGSNITVTIFFVTDTSKIFNHYIMIHKNS